MVRNWNLGPHGRLGSSRPLCPQADTAASSSNTFIDSYFFIAEDIILLDSFDITEAYTSIHDSFANAESYGVILGNVIIAFAEVSFVFLLFLAQQSREASRCQV